MSRVADTVTRLVTQLQAQMPGVAIFPVPPGENTPAREAVWVDAARASWEWRSLGATTANRDERVEVVLRVHAWRDGPDHVAAGVEARDRCLALVDQLDQAVATDQSLGGLCGAARVSDVEIALSPRDTGWAAEATVTVTADLIPAI